MDLTKNLALAKWDWLGNKECLYDSAFSIQYLQNSPSSPALHTAFFCDKSTLEILCEAERLSSPTEPLVM